MSTDPFVHDALTRAVPLRTELEPDWRDVIARTRPRRRVIASRWAVAGAVAAAAGLGVGGLAIADTIDSAPLHGATIGIAATTIGGPGGVSNCDLIGKTAARVSATLTAGGIGIEWRFTHWGTTVVASTGPNVPSAVTGGSSDAVSSVPSDSVVWDVDPDGRSAAFVFVEAPGDPNAPTVSTEGCPR